MSEIKKLMERLCPDGVEYKRLGDITEILRGRRLTKKELTDNAEYPVYHGGIEPIGYYSHHNRPANTVMIINVGASAGTVGYCNKPFWSSDGCYCIDKSELLSDRYLYYVLSKNQLAFVSKVRHAGIPTLDSKVIANFEIPVPPIEVQSKIVEILDNFTELEAELEIKLEAELEARRKQYEYYRNQLLTFDKDKGARFERLGDVCKIERGVRVVRKDLEIKGDIPVYQNSLIPLGYYMKSNYPENTPFIICGGGAGQIGFSTKPYWAADDCFSIVCPNSLNSKFVYYSMLNKNNYFISRVRKASIPRLSRSSVESFEIAIPPLEEQKRIVSILDRFEALTTDLQSGLPAEIEARRKQYEYYREKLLTFKRKTA